MVEKRKIKIMRNNELNLHDSCSKKRILDLQVETILCFNKAVKQNNTTLLKLIINNGFNNRLRLLFGLLYSCQQGYYDIVKLLIESSHINPAEYDNAALLIASKNGHLNIVKYLTDLLIQNNKQNNKYLSQRYIDAAIPEASGNNKYDIVDFFLSKKKQLRRYKCIDYVFYNKKNELLNEFIDYKIKENEYIAEAINFAAKNGHSELVKLLITYRHSIKQQLQECIYKIVRNTLYFRKEDYAFLFKSFMGMQILTDAVEEENKKDELNKIELHSKEKLPHDLLEGFLSAIKNHDWLIIEYINGRRTDMYEYEYNYNILNHANPGLCGKDKELFFEIISDVDTGKKDFSFFERLLLSEEGMRNCLKHNINLRHVRTKYPTFYKELLIFFKSPNLKILEFLIMAI
jgi:ankyrin repeat protein